MNIRGSSTVGGIGRQLHAIPFWRSGFLHGHANNLMAAPRNLRGQKFELTGKVLVNEKNIHLCSPQRQRDFIPRRMGNSAFMRSALLLKGFPLSPAACPKSDEQHWTRRRHQPR